MRLSTRQDIDLPPEQVFAAMSDVDAIERHILGRGIDLTRTDPGEGLHGASWRASFDYRGRRRVAARVVVMLPPERLVLAGAGEGLDVSVELDLLPRPKDATRLCLGIDLKPRSLQTRLLLQSLKLAKGSLLARLDERLGRWISTLETAQRQAG